MDIADKIAAAFQHEDDGGIYDRGTPEYYADLAELAVDMLIKAAVKACEEQLAAFSSEEYATGQPASSRGERFACLSCIDAIREIAQTQATEPPASRALAPE